MNAEVQSTEECVLRVNSWNSVSVRDTVTFFSIVCSLCMSADIPQFRLDALFALLTDRLCLRSSRTPVQLHRLIVEVLDEAAGTLVEQVPRLTSLTPPAATTTVDTASTPAVPSSQAIVQVPSAEPVTVSFAPRAHAGQRSSIAISAPGPPATAGHIVGRRNTSASRKAKRKQFNYKPASESSAVQHGPRQFSEPDCGAKLGTSSAADLADIASPAKRRKREQRFAAVDLTHN